MTSSVPTTDLVPARSTSNIATRAPSAANARPEARDPIGTPARDVDAVDVLGHARVGRHGAAQQREAGPRPAAVELVVSGRRAKVPHDRFHPARQEREARQLVAGPLADVGACDVADGVHVEAQEAAAFRGVELRRGPREPLASEPAKFTRSSQSTAIIPYACTAITVLRYGFEARLPLRGPPGRRG